MFNKRLLKEFAGNKKYVSGIVICQCIVLIANIIFTLYTAGIMADLLNKQYEKVNVLSYGVMAVSVIITRVIATTIMSKLSFASSSRVKKTLRDMIYDRLFKAGSHYRQIIATSEAVQISTEGVEQLEIYFGKYIPQFFYSMIAPLILFVIVGTMSIKTAIVLFICVPLIPASIVAVQKFAKKMLNRYWGTYTEMGDSFLENLQGLTTLKIYNADDRYAVKMDEEAEKFRKVTMRVLIMQLNSISIMDLVAYGGAALGIILSILDLKYGKIDFSQCFFIIMISAEFFLPMRMLGSFFHIAMNGNAAADKIFGFIDSVDESENIHNCNNKDADVAICNNKDVDVVAKDIAINNVTGRNIVADNVSTKKDDLEVKPREDDKIDNSVIKFSKAGFTYDGEKQILNSISFDIKKGNFVSIVGVSGCGKSTIASLIMGEHTNYSGDIIIDGVHNREYSTEKRYKKITRINHNSYLFKGSIRENLLMGKENASDSEIYEVLKQVDLYELVMNNGGLDMQIEERAANISGGQKQRFAVARALLKESDMYIFDEATSNVDAESENKIMEVINNIAKYKTVILVSHRLANVVNSDNILVMNEGTICESGTHNELMAKNGYYAELYNKQKELEMYSNGGDCDEE